MFAPALGFVADPLFKTKPVGSINPSTVNLPEIFKFTLLPIFSKCAPDVLELCVENITIFPSPFGVIFIAPSVFVDEIVFPSSLRLSTLKSVTALFVPIVTPSISPPLISALVITTEPVPFGVIFIGPLVFVDEIVFPSILILSTFKSVFTVREPSTTVLPLEASTVNLLSVPLLLISKSPLFNTLNFSVPTAFVVPAAVISAAAAIPIGLEDIAVVHLSPSVSPPVI